MLTINDLRNGTKLEIDGEPFVVTYFQHVNPGKGSAFVRTKIKSLTTGSAMERTWKSGDKIAKADIESMRMQFLYSDADTFHFMNMESYEQIEISADLLGDKKNYLKENTEVDMIFHDGRCIDVDLPAHMVLKVVHTEPGVRGDTATNVTKPATVETGAQFNVPLFIEEGNFIKVDTRTGSYIERTRGEG